MLAYKCAIAASFVTHGVTLIYLQRHVETTKTRFDLIEKIQRDKKRETETYIDDMIEEKMMQLRPSK